MENFTISEKALDIQSSIKLQQELSAQLTNVQSELVKAQAQQKLLETKYQAKAKELINNITTSQFAANLSENITLRKQLTNKIEGIDPKIANAIALELMEGISKDKGAIKAPRDEDLKARVDIHIIAKTKAIEALGEGVDDALAHKIATAYKDDLIKMQKLLKQQEAATANATKSWPFMRMYSLAQLISDGRR